MFIARLDKLVWDEELEQDSCPSGKHAAALDATFLNYSNHQTFAH